MVEQLKEVLAAANITQEQVEILGARGFVVSIGVNDLKKLGTPILTNPRHERFAQELAKGQSADAAYEAAGFKKSRSAASRLSAKVNIRSRVAELQSQTAERAIVTAESLIAEAEEARVGAIAAGRFAAAVSAIKEKGVLSGVRVEKRDNTTRHVTDLSDDELAAIARAGGDGAYQTPGRSPLTH